MTNTPLDQDHINPITSKALLQKLHAKGYYQSYETTDGNIEVKINSALKCTIVKQAYGWEAKVTADFWSSYVLLPAAAFAIIFSLLGFGGVIFVALAGLLGSGIGSLVLMNKIKNTRAQLEEIVYE